MYEAACCDDMLTWSMSGPWTPSRETSMSGRYEPAASTYAVCGGGLLCGPADPAGLGVGVGAGSGARPLYGTCSRTMTNRALNPSCRPTGCLGQTTHTAHSTVRRSRGRMSPKSRTAGEGLRGARGG